MLWQAAHFLKTFAPSAALVDANKAIISGPEVSELVSAEVVLAAVVVGVLAAALATAAAGGHGGRAMPECMHQLLTLRLPRASVGFRTHLLEDTRGSPDLFMETGNLIIARAEGHEGHEGREMPA